MDHVRDLRELFGDVLAMRAAGVAVGLIDRQRARMRGEQDLGPAKPLVMLSDRGVPGESGPGFPHHDDRREITGQQIDDLFQIGAGTPSFGFQ